MAGFKYYDYTLWPPDYGILAKKRDLLLDQHTILCPEDN